MSDVITIYADGACKGNPGIGGWGAQLEYKGHIKEIYGIMEYTTNNQMELTAVIEAIQCVNRPSKIVIYTDSQYVQKGISQWIHGWKQKNWRNVKNVELWQKLDSLVIPHNISWYWVEGHTGNVGNERADYLANLAIKEYLKR